MATRAVRMMVDGYGMVDRYGRTSRSEPLRLAAALVVMWMVVAAALGARPAAAQVEMAMPMQQQEPPALQALVVAFERGDAGDLMRHAARRLDVTIFGSNELFSRSQAGYVLKSFFAEYRPERLDLTETSGSAGNWFAAGRYWYVRGEEPLAIYFRLRQGDEEWELREVRIGRTIDR